MYKLLSFDVYGTLINTDPRPHRRRTGASQSSRRQDGPQAELNDHQKREAIRRRDIDGETVREIARSYNVSHSTISRLTA